MGNRICRSRLGRGGGIGGKPGRGDRIPRIPARAGRAATRPRKSRGRDCGMSIGLYADLAVGADPTGAECWSGQAFLARGATIGAPPDPLNLLGQNWGLPPLDPFALADAGYTPLTDLWQSNMRGGALRIDHILGLVRLFWIPVGAPAAGGAYVRYPWRELLGLLAAQSQRSRCLVIGEDLGTVPEGLREAMHATGLFSYRLL